MHGNGNVSGGQLSSGGGNDSYGPSQEWARGSKRTSPLRFACLHYQHARYRCKLVLSAIKVRMKALGTFTQERSASLHFGAKKQKQQK
jgi:hypothetical protein